MKYVKSAIIILFLVAFDQLTKYLIVANFDLYESYALIPDVFELCYIQNQGAAWGIFEGKQLFLILFTLLILAACCFVYIRIGKEKKYKLMHVLLNFIIAGALGNLIDRIVHHYVIDFFSFKLIHFPIFNVADIYVSVSVICLMLLLLFKYKESDLDELFNLVVHNGKSTNNIDKS